MSVELPEADQQLCWVHKTANVLDKLPDSMQVKAKTMVHNIYMAPTKKDANVAFDVFIEEFDAKYPRAVSCLRENRGKLMTFYDYPAEHWRHIRTTNPIESTFASVWVENTKDQGLRQCDRDAHNGVQAYSVSQRRWQRIHSHEKVADVWAGIKFEDGIRIEEILDGKLETAGV
jgi:transposase-like protein